MTGPEACGKTALISGAVGSEIRRSGGLILRHAGGALEISAAATGERRVFANAGPELAGYCAALLAEAAGAPFAVIDGLGGAELAEPELYEALVRFCSPARPAAACWSRPPARRG